MRARTARPRAIAFRKRKFLSGISNSWFDAFHEPERYFEHEVHCSLSKYRLFYATTKETMAGTPRRLLTRLSPAPFFFSLVLTRAFFRLLRGQVQRQY